MRSYRLLFVGLAMAGLACGKHPSQPDAGPADAGDPASILALKVGSCFEYTAGETASSPPGLGVAVESDSAVAVEYLPDGGYVSNVPTLKLVYRVGGLDHMEDFLRIEGGQLMLLKRQVSGAEVVEYHPAARLLALPFKNGDHYEGTGAIREFGSSADGGTQPYSLTYDVLSQHVGLPAGSYDGFAVPYVESPTHDRLARWLWSAGVGPVEVSGTMAGGDGGSATYKLQGTRRLSPGDQTCGAGN